MFKELSDKINYSQLEGEILKFWDENGIFEKSVSTRQGNPGYTFYEGPPTANGKPGIHHVMSRTLKDLVCRYKTMRGFQVHRKAGWDTHGLPVEIEVEKMLGFKHKEDIVKYGVENFNAKCKESVWKYKTDWERMTRLMGYWVDLKNPYVTFENNYIESVWWSLQQYFEKGLIYKGYKVQPYCPRCETPLSSHEVSLGYEDVKDLSVYVKMKVKGEENTYILVWTTTPWTLISNVALAVHPDIQYVKVEHKGQNLILAEARLNVLEGEYTVQSGFKGTDLLGKEYERIFNFHPVKERAFYVVGADFVTTEDGSGIVHMAPAYGEDDYQVSRKFGLPTIHPVNKSGEFGPEVTDFAGMFVKDADPVIIQNLKTRGILYKKETITHSYPHCWRCKTPLLYYARESWYIATTKYARRMVEINKTINWYPPEVGSGRFGNWLEENKDWSLSRDRFWGTPLPIWLCQSCGKQKCVGSVAELKEGKNVPEPIDLHKPYVDGVTFTCTCGGEMRRTPELIDVWYDSGSMPFAQWHYPFENQQTFKEQHPADFICEGIDQTRGWFYSLHSISTFLFDKPAYKNLIVNELILDKQGLKMSKSKGNTVNPFDVMEMYGADTTRWYLVTTSPPWRPTLFDEEGLKDVQRKFFGTLLNTYAFFSMYANIDGFTYDMKPLPLEERPEIDRWIISAVNSLVKQFLVDMDNYDVTKAARSVSNFTIDQLSNWYVRRNRRRFWSKGSVASTSGINSDKLSAYQTLHECLLAISKLMAPFAPFLAEELFRNLHKFSSNGSTDSVHLSMMPLPADKLIDLNLELRMDKAQRVVSLGRAIRTKANLKIRQPLNKILIPVKDQTDAENYKSVESIIIEELNVKELDPEVDTSIIKYSIKANFKVLGQKYGKMTQKVASVINTFNPGQIAALNAEGKIEVLVEGEIKTILLEDVIIHAEDITGWFVETDGKITVALDTNLTPALIAEGFAREFVNRVQNMRKDAGFEVMDRIKIYYHGTNSMSKAIEDFKKYIANETLAVDVINKDHNGEYSAEWDINNEHCRIGIERLPVSGN
ncbi:MAG: isoleucine--tRNA ligase [Bacteroidota bacterium]